MQDAYDQQQKNKNLLQLRRPASRQYAGSAKNTDKKKYIHKITKFQVWLHTNIRTSKLSNKIYLRQNIYQL